MGFTETEYLFPRVRFSMGGTRAGLVSYNQEFYCVVQVG